MARARDAAGRFVSGGGGGGGGTKTLGNAVLRFLGDDKGLQNTLKNVTQKVGAGMKQVGIAATAAGAAITGIATFAVKAASDFESAFAGVRKTVDATEEDFKKLSDGLREMSLRMPTSAAELAGIMEIAGQLGIKGVDNLLKFTETMARLADSTNIIGEEGALQLAQFMGVMNESLENVDRLGAAISALGNEFKTQEAPVLHIAKNMTAFGNEVGLTAVEVLAFATVISSAGGNAEAAATTFSKMGSKMKSAVLGAADGIEKAQVTLDKFAEIAGVSADEFAKKFKEEPMEAITLFLEGLKKIQEEGGDTGRALGGIFSPGSGEAPDRMAREIGKVIGQVSELRRATELSQTAFEENTALIKESEERYKTFASQLAILKNLFTDLAINIGDMLIPELKKLIDEHIKPLLEKIKEWIKENPELTEQIVKWTAAIGAGLLILGPFLLALSSIVTIVPALVAGIKLVSAALMWLWANPIGLIILAIALIAYAVYKNWDKIKEYSKKAWDWLVDNFKKFWEAVKHDWETVTTGLGNKWRDLWGLIWDILVWIWEKILDFLTWAWERVVDILIGGLDLLFPRWRDGWEKFKVVIVNVFNGIKAFLAGFYDWLKKDFFDPIGAMFQWMFRQIDRLPFINISGIPDQGNFLGPGSGAYVAGGSIPRFGPNTVTVGGQVPNSGPSSLVGAQMPGGAGVNVYVTVQGNVLSNDDFARDLSTRIQRLAWEAMA